MTPQEPTADEQKYSPRHCLKNTNSEKLSSMPIYHAMTEKAAIVVAVDRFCFRAPVAGYPGGVSVRGTCI